ncbi:hypothetical protein AWN66_04825 [Klebsiella pneumoniae subsp. pneumoniae]|nr:hypothetical protein AWN66_04760 [Klebsiella pneumoniae subsp. pneumoniae]AMA15034.1 hypothetical protein AWN66_04790 [Klebsiella pneumoniae subsp. pneumoniae]AMA15040.1 hypothetical protein AWN66_04825 [Klebsiella pneumoniae subsp. pneumoniae]
MRMIIFLAFLHNLTEIVFLDYTPMVSQLTGFQKKVMSILYTQQYITKLMRLSCIALRKLKINSLRIQKNLIT